MDKSIFRKMQDIYKIHLKIFIKAYSANLDRQHNIKHCISNLMMNLNCFAKNSHFQVIILLNFLLFLNYRKQLPENMNLRKCKNLIKAFDLFSQPVTLRYSNQTDYESMTGGFCSIILFIVFIAVFMGTLINTLNKKYISATIKRYEQIQPSFTKVNTSQFLFAVGISGINLNEGERWFDVQFLYRKYNNGTRVKIPIQLQRCTQSQWQNINQNLTGVYNRLKLQEQLCPPQNLQLELQGKYSSEMFKFYKIAVKQCNNSLIPERSCVSTAQMQAYLDYYQVFTFNFYFLNTVLNPDDHQCITQYLQDFNYFPFNKKTVTNANLFISEFQIDTDQSIFPFQQIEQKQGGIVLTNALPMNYQSRQQQYMRFFLRKSSQSLKIQRSYRKIDDTLSYIGGLFSAILSVLVLMGIYNTYCYELQVAQNLYKFNKDQSLQPDNFNFIIFLLYLFWLGMFKIGYILEWKIMKNYHKCLNQVLKQMDIRLIFKKLLYSQRVAQSLLEKHQLKLLHLQQPLTLEQIKIMRQDYRYYNKLKNYYFQNDNLNTDAAMKEITQQKKQQNILVTSSTNSQEYKSTTKNKSVNQFYLNPNIEDFIVNDSKIGGTFQMKKHCNKDNISGTFIFQNSAIFGQDKTNQFDATNQKKTNNQIQKLKQEEQLKNIVMQFKAYLFVLKNQANFDEQVSRKILNSIDHKILNKLTQNQKQCKIQKTLRKQSSQIQKLVQSYQSQKQRGQPISLNIFHSCQQNEQTEIKITRPPILKKQVRPNTNTTTNANINFNENENGNRNRNQNKSKCNKQIFNKTMGKLTTKYENNLNKSKRSQRVQRTYKKLHKQIYDIFIFLIFQFNSILNSNNIYIHPQRTFKQIKIDVQLISTQTIHSNIKLWQRVSSSSQPQKFRNCSHLTFNLIVLQFIIQYPSEYNNLSCEPAMKLQKLKSLIKAFDLFSQPATLRYSQQSSYSSLTGGFCSITLIVIFVAVFTGTLSNTLNKIYIASTVTKYQQVDPSYYTVGSESFMFAIGLSGINMNQGNRWFDVSMQFRSYDSKYKNKTVMALQKCQKYQWENINKTLAEFYDRLKLNQWLCPKDNVQFQLQGKFTSQLFKFYKISVKQCNNALNPLRPCVASSQIDSFILANEAFNFNFYFVNTILNPNDKQYVTHYFDDFNYFPFTRTTGTNANLFISSYGINTDQSIYPFEENSQKNGGIVLSNAQVINYEIKKNQYLKFNIRKSSLSLKVQRSYRKIDDTLSYIGGLFSAIVSVCLLMGMYNQFSYELQIAQSLYKYDKDESLQGNKFNFGWYLGYIVYSGFDAVGIGLPWKKMKMYKRSLDQVREQMDIRLVFRKLFFMEKVAGCVLEPHQIKSLHFQEELTLQEVYLMRDDYQFHAKLKTYYFQYGAQAQSAKVTHQNSNKQSKQNKQNGQYKWNKQNRQQTQHKIQTTEHKLQIDCDGSIEQFYRSSSVATPDQSFNESHLQFGQRSKNKVGNKFNQNKIFDQDKDKNKNKDLNQKEMAEPQSPPSSGDGDIDNTKMKKIIRQLKQYITLLQKQSEAGERISKKIYQKLDQRLASKVMEDQTEQKQRQQRQQQKDQQMEEHIKKQTSLNQANKTDGEHHKNIVHAEQVPKIIVTNPNKSIKQRKLNDANRVKNKNALNKSMGSMDYHKDSRNIARKGGNQIKQLPKNTQDFDGPDE